MKILLIKPNLLRKHDREGHGSSLLTGLLAIAAHVREPDRLRIALYPDDYDYIRESMDWCDAVGLSAFTFEYEYCRRLSRALAERYPDKLYFIGGCHVTLTGRYDTRLFDFMVAGEGECVVQALAAGEIAVEKSGNFKKLQAPGRLKAHEIPLGDVASYPFWRRLIRSRASIISSRGCRYCCRFCTSPGLDRTRRIIPVERLARLIVQTVTRLKSPKINIWDDNFTDDPERLETLGRLLVTAGVRLREVSVFCRTASRIRPGVFTLLEKLGVDTLITGYESGSQRVLKYLKGADADMSHIKANSLRARDHGMTLHASVMFGVPGETIRDMEQTLDLMRWKAREDIPGPLYMYAAVPLPGSRFWETALKRKKVDPDMNFEPLSYNNFDAPLLLDDDIPLNRFHQIINRARQACHAMDRVTPRRSEAARYRTMP